jgi:hypothetical protein
MVVPFLMTGVITGVVRRGFLCPVLRWLTLVLLGDFVVTCQRFYDSLREVQVCSRFFGSFVPG